MKNFLDWLLGAKPKPKFIVGELVTFEVPNSVKELTITKSNTLIGEVIEVEEPQRKDPFCIYVIFSPDFLIRANMKQRVPETHIERYELAALPQKL